MILLMHISEYELSELSEDRLAEMLVDVPESFPTDIFEEMTYSLRNPTGVWADFNPVFNYWYYLYPQIAHKIGKEYMPYKPLPKDYSNLTLPKTPNFPRINS